jgi:hypothetical protein
MENWTSHCEASVQHLVGSIILEEDVSGNPEDEDLHDGLDPASTSESSESEAEDFSHINSQIQIRLIENGIALLIHITRYL